MPLMTRFVAFKQSLDDPVAEQAMGAPMKHEPNNVGHRTSKVFH